MNIYIQMEIAVRELEGRLLLALAAAERGHRVLLGEVRPLLTAAAEGLPPGIFHDKSLTPSAWKRDVFANLVDRGSVLTSQDEEHWLALPTFDVPARKRFSAETIGRAARSFAWGEHEAKALTRAYPEVAPGRVIATGSPRADLWRPDLDNYYRGRPLRSIEAGRDYLLVSSNFSAVLDVNPFWVRMRDKRQHFDGSEDPFELDRYPFTARKFIVLGEYVRAIRRLAAAHPEVLIVVRPHPIEARGAWRDLLGEIPNVLVTRERTLTAWVRGALGVIQNDCTSAYEAAISGVPVITFQPDGLFAENPPNALGRRASDQDELARLVSEVIRLSSTERAAWIPDEGRTLLVERLSALDGPLATDRIVAEWEAVSPALEGRAAPWQAVQALRIRRRLRARRAASRVAERAQDIWARPWARSAGAVGDERPDGSFATAHKFPPLQQSEVDAIVSGLSKTLGRFIAVEARVIAPDLIEIAKRPA